MSLNVKSRFSIPIEDHLAGINCNVDDRVIRTAFIQRTMDEERDIPTDFFRKKLVNPLIVSVL